MPEAEGDSGHTAGPRSRQVSGPLVPAHAPAATLSRFRDAHSAASSFLMSQPLYSSGLFKVRDAISVNDQQLASQPKATIHRNPGR